MRHFSPRRHLMNFFLQNSSVSNASSLSPRDTTAVLAIARRLQRAHEAGEAQTLLRGKNLGLLCEQGGSADATLFRQAAVELGAHVAHVRPNLSTFRTSQEIHDMARLLGRLYDAVECQGLTPAQVQSLSKDAGVPVYDGLASSTHATAPLAMLLLGIGPLADRRRFVLQAMLVQTMTCHDKV